MINTAHGPPKEIFFQNIGGVPAKVGGVRTVRTPQWLRPCNTMLITMDETESKA